MIFIIRILRFFIITALVYFLFRFLWKGNLFGFLKREKKSGSSKPLEEMKKDPVCGTYIPESQALKLNWKKESFYFCSEECKKKFQKLHQ
jgi:uncharacterized protein